MKSFEGFRAFGSWGVMMRQYLRGHGTLRIGAEFDRCARFSPRDRSNKGCANHLLVICTGLPDRPAYQPAADESSQRRSVLTRLSCVQPPSRQLDRVRLAEH